MISLDHLSFFSFMYAVCCSFVCRCSVGVNGILIFASLLDSCFTRILGARRYQIIKILVYLWDITDVIDITDVTVFIVMKFSLT